MAIQMRRGSIVDFDPSKMVPGEWAIPYDNNDIIFICTSQGHVVEIASSTIIRTYMENAEAWAVGEKNGVPVSDTDIQYENNSKYYAEQAKDSADNADISESNSEAWAVGERGGLPVPSTDDTYENNSKYYAKFAGEAWENIDNAMQIVTPTMQIDFDTGILSYTGSFFDFILDKTTGHLEWGVAV